MATRNLVPRANGEGTIGTALKKWLGGFFKWLSIEQYIQFIPNGEPSYQEGRIYYDSTDKSLNLMIDKSDIRHNLGREFLVRVYNGTGSKINDGQVVKLADVGAPTSIVLAKADTEANAKGTLGMVTSDIPDDSIGYITTLGVVHNLNTSSFVLGDRLYLSDTDEGKVTNVKPAIAIFIGYVLSVDAYDGQIFINVSETFSGAGDMLKATYDIDDNGIVDKAEVLTDGGSGNEVTYTEAQDAVDKAHEHSNKTELDLVTDGDHDVRTDNPHEISFLDIAEIEQANSEGITSSTSQTYINKLTWSFTPSEQADYIISWYYEDTNSNVNKGIRAKIELDDTTELGVNSTFTEIAEEYDSHSGFSIVNLTAVEHTVDLDFLLITTGIARLRRVRIYIRKIS